MGHSTVLNVKLADKSDLYRSWTDVEPLIQRELDSLNKETDLPSGQTSIADFIEKDEAESSAVALILIDRFLGQKRRSFAVPQISWRRTNQFRNFVRVLEFRAIHFDYRPAVSE